MYVVKIELRLFFFDPKTNSEFASENEKKAQNPTGTFHLKQPSIFKGYVCFRESNDRIFAPEEMCSF